MNKFAKAKFLSTISGLPKNIPSGRPRQMTSLVSCEWHHEDHSQALRVLEPEFKLAKFFNRST